ERLAAAVKVHVSRMTISRTLRQLGLTWKKRCFGQPIKTLSTDSRRASHTRPPSMRSPLTPFQGGGAIYEQAQPYTCRVNFCPLMRVISGPDRPTPDTII